MRLSSANRLNYSVRVPLLGLLLFLLFVFARTANVADDCGRVVLRTDRLSISLIRSLVALCGSDVRVLLGLHMIIVCLTLLWGWF